MCNINFWIENDHTPPLALFQKFIRFGSRILPLFTHHIVWMLICILYSIFNNIKISWDILLKIKKMFSPQNPGRGWTTWLQVGKLEALKATFFAPNINLKPGSKWCRTWETKRSRHRPCAPALGFNMRRRQTIKDVRGILPAKASLLLEATLLKSLEYLRKYFPSLTSSSAISFWSRA